MIDKTKLASVITAALEGTDCYIVDIKVNPDNDIIVEIDSDSIVDIEQCVKITREIEASFDREEEDYSLEVGSAGLTSPLKVARQYQKYIGHEVEALTRDGKKHRGLLMSYDPETGDITIEETVKEKPEGEKRPRLVTRQTVCTAEMTNKVIPIPEF